jgi:hypothetical protein
VAQASHDKMLSPATASVVCVSVDSLTQFDDKPSVADRRRIDQTWSSGSKRPVDRDGHWYLHHHLQLVRRTQKFGLRHQSRAMNQLNRMICPSFCLHRKVMIP